MQSYLGLYIVICIVIYIVISPSAASSSSGSNAIALIAQGSAGSGCSNTSCGERVPYAYDDDILMVDRMMHHDMEMPCWKNRWEWPGLLNYS